MTEDIHFVIVHVAMARIVVQVRRGNGVCIIKIKNVCIGIEMRKMGPGINIAVVRSMRNIGVGTIIKLKRSFLGWCIHRCWRLR